MCIRAPEFPCGALGFIYDGQHREIRTHLQQRRADLLRFQLWGDHQIERPIPHFHQRDGLGCIRRFNQVVPVDFEKFVELRAHNRARLDQQNGMRQGRPNRSTPRLRLRPARQQDLEAARSVRRPIHREESLVLGRDVVRHR